MKRINPSQLVGIREFARQCGLSRTAVIFGMARGELESVLVAGRQLLRAEDVAGFKARVAARRSRGGRPVSTGGGDAAA